MKLIIDSKQVKQTGEKLNIVLQNIIDNSNDKYFLAVRDISYCASYFYIYTLMQCT